MSSTSQNSADGGRTASAGHTEPAASQQNRPGGHTEVVDASASNRNARGVREKPGGRIGSGACDVDLKPPARSAVVSGALESSAGAGLQMLRAKLPGVGTATSPTTQSEDTPPATVEKKVTPQSQSPHLNPTPTMVAEGLAMATAAAQDVFRRAALDRTNKGPVMPGQDAANRQPSTSINAPPPPVKVRYTLYGHEVHAVPDLLDRLRENHPDMEADCRHIVDRAAHSGKPLPPLCLVFLRTRYEDHGFVKVALGLDRPENPWAAEAMHAILHNEMRQHIPAGPNGAYLGMGGFGAGIHGTIYGDGSLPHAVGIGGKDPRRPRDQAGKLIPGTNSLQSQKRRKTEGGVSSPAGTRGVLAGGSRDMDGNDGPAPPPIVESLRESLRTLFARTKSDTTVRGVLEIHNNMTAERARWAAAGFNMADFENAYGIKNSSRTRLNRQINDLKEKDKAKLLPPGIWNTSWQELKAKGWEGQGEEGKHVLPH